MNAETRNIRITVFVNADERRTLLDWCRRQRTDDRIPSLSAALRELALEAIEKESAGE